MSHYLIFINWYIEQVTKEKNIKQFLINQAPDFLYSNVQSLYPWGITLILCDYI